MTCHEEKIKDYFLSQGYKEESIENDSFQIFSSKNSKAAVTILSLEDLEDRHLLMEALLKTASNPELGDKIYVAMPKLLAAIIDGKILEEIGLGLLIYGEGGVEELVPAKKKNYMSPIQAASMDSITIREMQILKTEISELKVTVENLKLELNILKEKKTVKTTGEYKEVKPLEMKVSTSQSSRLPSFFQENPWLSVLSQRGRETEEIAS